MFAKRNTRQQGGVLFDEFVVYDPDQAYPKYIIHYTKGGTLGNPNTQIKFGGTFTTGRQEVLPTRGLDPYDPLDVHFRIAESQFLRLVNNLGGNMSKLKVKKVDVYMNPVLKGKFDAKLAEFKTKYTATPQHSQYLMLFHGTKSRDAVTNIMDNNFQCSLGGKFGPGVYFSEYPSYTFGYGGMSHLIVAQVLPGKTFAMPAPRNQPLEPGYDSHGGVARGDGTFAEIVIFNTDQILPCYVIHIEETA